MIRIVDEPIFSMTRLEYMELHREYDLLIQKNMPNDATPPTFERWLMLIKLRGYTTYREENP